MADCSHSCASGGGACDCARAGRTPCWRHSAASISTRSMRFAGMLIALDSGLDQTMVVIGLKAFAPALVGGLDSLIGALVGAIIVAGAEVLAIHYIDPLLSDVVPFLVLIATLIVRPWGLFGTREELDRV